MSQVSKEKILELQKIFKEDYGKELTYSEATEVSNSLVGYFDLLLKTDVETNPEKYNLKKD